MKYWKIRTNEGNGVLHIIFRGKYIPQKWLSEQWAEIHKSPIVDIRSLYETKKGLKGIAFYLVGNYLAKQSFERMSWGYSWVFPAFVRSWKRLIEKYGFKQALFLWNRLLFSPFVVTRQVRLTNSCAIMNIQARRVCLGAHCSELLSLKLTLFSAVILKRLKLLYVPVKSEKRVVM